MFSMHFSVMIGYHTLSHNKQHLNLLTYNKTNHLFTKLIKACCIQTLNTKYMNLHIDLRITPRCKKSIKAIVKFEQNVFVQ